MHYGAVVEKKQAEARYEETLAEGNAAIMLEKNRDHSYSLNLGNLAPREACVVTLRYAQILQFHQHGLRLLIPTVIAPRYGDAVIDGGLQPYQVASNDPLAEYPFDISLRLHGDLARARVASPSHPVGVVIGDNMLTVALARRGALDRDFVLVIDQLAQDSMAVLARDCVETDHVVALASFSPRVAVAAATGLAVKILVDCSGSMAGDSIDAARRALQSVVRQLEKGDRFSLSRFGNTVQHRSRGLWQTTEVTRLGAQRWVGGLQADLGGTEMGAALASTFALANSAASDVLIVTDGEIDAIEKTIALAKASGHRLFVVGIGSSPAESHLHRLAEATGGACDFVAPGESVEPAILRMFARLRSPRLSELSVVWPGESKPIWVSPIHASIFEGDTVNVFALMERAPAGEVCLLGVGLAGGHPSEIARATFNADVTNGDTLSRVAASVRIQSAAVDSLVGTAPQAQSLALAYQLVTDETNFLLIHERAEEDKAIDMPALAKVAPMLPAGWGGMGNVMFSRSRATLRENVGEYQVDALQSFDLAAAPAPQSLASMPLFSRKSDSAAPHAGELYDIPQFLRKQLDDVDRSDSQFWSREGGHAGLAPLGLSEWLRTVPMQDWPTSYAGLRKIGAGAWVVDWLELAIACEGEKQFSEQAVVATFLYVMSQQDLRDFLANALGAKHGFKRIAQKLRGLIIGSKNASDLAVDAALVEQITSALDGMTAAAWPDEVFALGSAEGASDDKQGAATVG